MGFGDIGRDEALEMFPQLEGEEGMRAQVQAQLEKEEREEEVKQAQALSVNLGAAREKAKAAVKEEFGDKDTLLALWRALDNNASGKVSLAEADKMVTELSERSAALVPRHCLIFGRRRSHINAPRPSPRLICDG